MNQNRDFITQFTKIIPFDNFIPFLYRYEDQQWIDDFFENGNLKLSTFINYKTYEDNQLGDSEEGHTHNVLRGNNDKIQASQTIVGLNEYCFCTSTLLDNGLKQTFSRNSVFRIDDPLNFMIEVSSSIPRLAGVLFGNCVYQDDRIISENVELPIMPEKYIGEGLNNHSEAFRRRRYFLKRIEYQPQSEYRILFSAERINPDGLIVHCPEARQFCSKI